MTNLLSDIITYVRRIIKSPSNALITDNLIVDYINRFWMIDVDARVQLFDLKTTYQFQTTPGVDQYNMPLYSTQTQSQTFTQIPVNLAPQAFPDGTANYSANLLSIIQLNDPTAQLVPGSVQFWFDYGLGNQTLYTDSNGFSLQYVTGPFTISSSTINYQTGAISFAFTSIPGATIPAIASFTYKSLQSSSTVAMFPVYQGFFGPAYINGIEMPFYTQRSYFNNLWPNYSQVLLQVGTGDGMAGPYTLQLPFLPNGNNLNTNQITSAILRGHVDINGIIALNAGNVDPPVDTGTGTAIAKIPVTSSIPQVYFTSTAADGTNSIVQDSGVFLSTNQNYGLLIAPGNAPYGNTALSGGYSTTLNTVNYQTGLASNITFPKPIPAGTPIQGQCVYYQTGIPRAVLFYNNVITLRAPPDTQYQVQLNAFLTPAAFFNSAQSVPFGYMAEYIARGSARKILSDTGDVEQFQFYEPLFREQELLVWKRSQRIWTSTRTQTIYSQDGFPNTFNNSSLGI